MVRILLPFVSFLLSFFTAFSQESPPDIEDAIKSQLEVPREVAYLHLNKSTYLLGEQVGLTAYVLDRRTMEPSRETTNLYVQLKDARGRVAREKLLLVRQGTTTNTIMLDSTLAPGTYTISAYTNWMRNFKGHDHFVQQLTVLKTDRDPNRMAKTPDGQPDIQILPESGHFLSGLVNAAGVVVRGIDGRGMAGAQVAVRDGDGKKVAGTTLNAMGVGRIAFLPVEGKVYTATVSYGADEFTKKLSLEVEQEGIVLSAVRRGGQLQVSVRTNDAGARSLSGRNYSLVLSSMDRNTVFPFTFGEEKVLPITFDLDLLSPGMQVFTVFDDRSRPVAERLFFNHNYLPIAQTGTARAVSMNDSLEVRIPVPGGVDSLWASVSVLPSGTVSHEMDHNIISQAMVQPFVKGHMENGSWYFGELDDHRMQQLDHLLLTQGWSSYDWEGLFNAEREFDHPFERFLDLTATATKDPSRRHGRSTSSTQQRPMPRWSPISTLIRKAL